MIERDKLRDIAGKGPKKRDPACVQLQADIVIPRGTILRQEPGKQGTFKCRATFGTFSVEGVDVHQHTDIYRLVTSA
jgi:hypothetical protein